MFSFCIVLFAYLFSQFYRAFLAVVTVDLTRDLGFTPAELGNISAIWFIAFAFAQFPVGYCLDHFGPRRTIAGFMLSAVLGAGLFGIAQGYASTLLAMALIGVGCAPILMGGLYIFGMSHPPARFALLSSLLIGLGNIGNLLSAAPLTFAVQAIGWRHAMLGIAGLTALSVAGVFLFLPDPKKPTREGPRTSAMQDLLMLARIKVLWPIFALSAVSYAVVASERGLWIGPYLKTVYDFDAVARGNAAFSMGLAMTLGALSFGPLERFMGGPKPVNLLSGFATAACLIALGTTPNLTGGAAVMLLTMVGACGMSYALLMTHGRQFYPEHLLGRGVTLQNFLFIGGASLLQSLSGQFISLSEAEGIGPATSYARLHLGFGLALFLATVIYASARGRKLAAG